jgi:hypothetical protein
LKTLHDRLAKVSDHVEWFGPEGMDDLPLEFDEGPRSEQRIAEIKSALPQLCDKHPWIPRFLLELRTFASVKEACEIAGISRQTAYTIKNTYPRFAEAWVYAEQDGVDELEAAARKRALTGSVPLTTLLLKAHRPEVYDRKLPASPVAAIQITSNGKTRNIASAGDLSDEELDAMIFGQAEVTGDASALFGAEEDGDEFGDDSKDEDAA